MMRPRCGPQRRTPGLVWERVAYVLRAARRAMISARAGTRTRMVEPGQRSELRGFVVLAVAVAGVVATAVTAWAVARSPILVDPVGSALARSAFVAAYAAVGMYTWWRRPTSRLGPVLIGAA